MTTFCLYQLRKVGGKGEQLEINIGNAWLWLGKNSSPKKEKEKKLKESSLGNKQNMKNHHPPKGNREWFSKVANICPWGESLLQIDTWHRLKLSLSLCTTKLSVQLGTSTEGIHTYLICAADIWSQWNFTSFGEKNGTYSLKN